MLNVIVVDAQGGGLGASVVKSLRERYRDRINITALGTNSFAADTMKKSGAHSCAVGEDAICQGVNSAGVIMGGIGIIVANGMRGEITPAIARAISESPAKKILIPFSKCNILIPEPPGVTAKELIAIAVETISELI